VQAVCGSGVHAFSKDVRPSIVLVAGHGVAGDAHSGKTVQHRSRLALDPNQPNLRQVHLIHAELLNELRGRGFDVQPGALGENITTEDLDLLGMSVDTLLNVGATAVVRITGLRNPCRQLDAFAPGLMEAVLERRSDGTIVRKCGIMGVVVTGGTVRPGDPISVELPAGAHRRLERV
jgi:MOSC domain-containing protein YiiM